MTTKDLIRTALLHIGGVGHNEVLTASEFADGLRAFELLKDSWITEHLLSPSITQFEHVLTPFIGKYSIGTTPPVDFLQPRPVRLERLGLRILDNPSYELPLKIITYDQWADLIVKDTSSSYPVLGYLEGSLPNSALYLYPVPTIAHTLVLYCWNILPESANVEAELVLPPGYARALVYNLTIELASMYGFAPTESVVRIAMDSKASIKRLNSEPVVMKFDEVLTTRAGQQRSGFNYLIG